MVNCMMYDDFISRQDLIDELFPRGMYVLGQAMYAKDVYNAIVRMKGVKTIPAEKIDLVELSAYLEKTRAKAVGRTGAPLAYLRLSARTYNVLLGNQVETIGDLLQHSAQDLIQIRHIGPRAIAEIRECLDAFLRSER